MLVETSSHVISANATKSIACHLANPVTNEYQSERRDNFLPFLVDLKVVEQDVVFAL